MQADDRRRVAPAAGGAVLGAVVLTAGVGKLLPGAGFRRSLEGYAHHFGWSVEDARWNTLATLLPWLQVGLVGTMLAAFAAVHAVALRGGPRLDCGCFGLLAAGPVRPATVARDTALAALGLLLAVGGCDARR